MLNMSCRAHCLGKSEPKVRTRPAMGIGVGLPCWEMMRSHSSIDLKSCEYEAIDNDGLEDVASCGAILSHLEGVES
jgi:hypothetical protein